MLPGGEGDDDEDFEPGYDYRAASIVAMVGGRCCWEFLAGAEWGGISAYKERSWEEDMLRLRHFGWLGSCGERFVM